MSNTAPTPVAVDLEKAYVSVKFLEAKLELLTQRQRTHELKNRTERRLFAALYIAVKDRLDLSAEVSKDKDQYLEAHKAFSEAENNLLQVEIAQVKSELTVTQALIKRVKECEDGPKIAEPGKLIV